MLKTIIVSAKTVATPAATYSHTIVSDESLELSVVTVELCVTVAVNRACCVLPDKLVKYTLSVGDVAAPVVIPEVYKRTLERDVDSTVAFVGVIAIVELDGRDTLVPDDDDGGGPQTAL